MCWISVHAVEGFHVVRFPVAGFEPFLAWIVGLGFGRIDGPSRSGGDGRGHAADGSEKVAAVHRRLLIVTHRSSHFQRPLPCLYLEDRCYVTECVVSGTFWGDS